MSIEFDPSLFEYAIENLTEAEIADLGLEIVDGEIAPEAAEELLSEMHSDTATDVQQLADEATDVGDYEAAQDFREIAEEISSLADDQSMLHGADSVELEAASEHQEQAENYQDQQAQHVEEGNFEAAREDSMNAVSEMQDADFLAGGSDHSGQAQLEHDQMDWAVFHEEQADYYTTTAEAYAEDGNFDAAADSLEVAGGQQDAADWQADMGQHDGAMADFDPTAGIETFDTSSTTTDISTTDDFSVE